MVPLLFAVGAKSWGVPCADFRFFVPGEFSLEVLQVVGLFLHEGHEALVAVSQCGVI